MNRTTEEQWSEWFLFANFFSMGALRILVGILVAGQHRDLETHVITLSKTFPMYFSWIDSRPQ